MHNMWHDSEHDCGIDCLWSLDQKIGAVWLHGRSGVGKTHLIQSAARAIELRLPL